MPGKKTDIPEYELDNFRPVHRLEQADSSFGYNNLDKSRVIPDFELYSSVGLVGSAGPLRSEFYRISISVSGTLDMQIGLERFRHQPSTISFTIPHQIFQKNNFSKDAFGYYMLFKPLFLQDLLPAVRLPEEFPFFGLTGTPLFQLSEDELARIIGLVQKIDEERGCCLKPKEAMKGSN